MMMPYKDPNYSKKYREANKEAIRKYNKKWEEENQDKVKATRKRYYEKNKEAIRETRRKYYKEHEEEEREKNRIYHNKRKTTIPYRARKMRDTARYNSKQKNIIFNINENDVEELWPEDNKCPALRVDFIMGTKGGADYSPSLDRIVPKLGYVKGNLQIISFLANKIMNNATPEQVIQVGEYFKRVTEELGNDSEKTI
jgi:hypothetical protein